MLTSGFLFSLLLFPGGPVAYCFCAVPCNIIYMVCFCILLKRFHKVLRTSDSGEESGDFMAANK